MAIFGSKTEQQANESGRMPDDVVSVGVSSSDGAMGAEAVSIAVRQAAVPSSREEMQRPSVISEGFLFVGEIRGKGPLTVEGSTEGVVDVGSLVIGVGGRSQGQISAKSINVKGRMSGIVTCDELVIGGRAEVDGEVTYGSLTIQRGGTVRGDLKRK